MTDPRETNSNELTEAGTCRMYVTPKLVAAGWDNSPHEIAEQRTITDGKIYISVTRLAPKSPTYSPTQTKTLGAVHHSSVDGLIALLCPLDTKQSKIIATLLNMPPGTIYSWQGRIPPATRLSLRCASVDTPVNKRFP